MARPLAVPLAVAQLDEDAMGVLGMDPRDVRAPVIHPRALLPEVGGGGRNVLALEPHEVHALAVPGEKAARCLVRVRRLEQLDVADASRQDRVLEPELL